MTPSALSRPVRADTIGQVPRAIEVEADEAERAALARRFNLEAIDRLVAQVSVIRADHDVIATGRIRAQVVQSCAVTGEPLPATVDETFAVRFRPEPTAGSPQEEVELSGDDLDVIFQEGAMVDVGEAVAQTLALNLDPFPRSPAARASSAPPVAAEAGEPNPFAALAALKDKLGNG